MELIKFGLKLWSTNTEFIDEAQKLIERNLFNFIELTYFPGTNIDPFKNRKIDYIVHLPTNRHGVNIGDIKDIEKNLEIIQKGLEWTDQLDAKYAILHPGYGDLEDIKTFLDEINDERILIENMPVMGLNGQEMIGYSSAELAELKDEKFGICLDLNHAIKAAVSLNKDYKKYIKELLKLNPQIFHIADGKLDFKKDEHLNIGEGEYDWEFLTNVIKESDCDLVTLETPRETLEDDLKNLRMLKTS